MDHLNKIKQITVFYHANRILYLQQIRQYFFMKSFIIVCEDLPIFGFSVKKVLDFQL